MRPLPRDLHAGPPELLGEAVDAYGLHATLDTSIALLDGAEDYDGLPVPLTFLGGASAHAQLLKGHLEARRQTHWPRTWAARALLHVWADYAEDPVVRALGDAHWRVREMAAKVIALRTIDGADDALLGLAHDDEPRVQVAGLRAIAVVGNAASLVSIGSLTSDDRAVQIASSSATRAMRLRLGVGTRG